MFVPAIRVACLLLLVGCTASLSPDSAFNPEPTDTVARNGQPLQALYDVEVRASADGWTPALARTAGDLWASAGDSARALEFWQLAAQSAPDDAVLVRRVAQVAVELQRWSEAVIALDQLLLLTPDDAWAHFQLGLIRAAFNQRAAESHLRAAMREPGYEPAALAILNALQADNELPEGMAAGLVLAALEQWSYAELAFRHVAALAAPYPVALAYTALARDQQGKAAERWIAEAVALAPDDAQVRYLQGLHLRMIGDNHASLDALALAMSLDPENPAYHAELGSAYRLVGDLVYAEYWLESAVRVSNQDVRFVDLLTAFYAEEAGNLTDEGVSALVEVVSISDDANRLAGTGWALWQAGRHDAAMLAFDTALEREPENVRALFYKGRALIESGEFDAGTELLAQVADRNADFAEQAAALMQTAQSDATAD